MNGVVEGRGGFQGNECGTATGKNVLEGKNNLEGEKECGGSTKQNELEKKK
jgi:hypothetical protein